MARTIVSAKHTNQAKFRRYRETYVPSRIARMIREEGRLMLDFDSAKTARERLEVSAGLCRVRGLILAAIGWPKPPTLRGGAPMVLTGAANHNPLLDLDAEPIDAAPSEPSDGAPT